jgi:hypothetical protein
MNTNKMSQEITGDRRSFLRTAINRYTGVQDGDN